MRVRAALSRDGIEVYGNYVNMNPQESQEILLQVIISAGSLTLFEYQYKCCRIDLFHNLSANHLVMSI